MKDGFSLENESKGGLFYLDRYWAFFPLTLSFLRMKLFEFLNLVVFQRQIK